jgi:hypothetical protein
MAGGLRKLHNEEFHDMYSSSNVIRMLTSRRMKWSRHVARMGQKSTTYTIMVGRQEGKRPVGIPGRRYVDNIEMGRKEMGWGDMDWIDLVQDRVK